MSTVSIEEVNRLAKAVLGRRPFKTKPNIYINFK